MEKENRKRILSAAAKLFSRHGFETVSVQNICDQAEITKPTLYYYFKSKQNLYDQLLVEAIDLMDRYMQSTTRADLSFCERLERMFVEMLRYVEDNEDYTRFIMRIYSPVKVEAPCSMMQDHPKKRFVLIKEMMEEGIRRKELPADLDIPVAAMVVIGAINTLIIHTLLKTGFTFNKQDIAKRMVRFIFGSLPIGKE